MSILRPYGRLSIKRAFSKIQALRTGGWNLDEVEPGSHSGRASSVTSANGATARATRRKLLRTEPCFITKRIAITHERTHWISAVQGDPETNKLVEKTLIELGIVSRQFHLNSLANLTNLDPMLHAALEKYAAIAVTGTPQSLDFLIEKVKQQNAIWQDHFNNHHAYIRRFDTFEDSYTGLEYELVLLLPHHIFPDGMDLSFYRRVGDTIQSKFYMVGPDRVLRETPGTADSPRLPPFTFDSRGPDAVNLNPFLVILNAEIRFRQCIRERRHTRLAPEVQELMRKTCELVDEIYWKPVDVEVDKAQGRLRSILIDSEQEAFDSSSVSAGDPAESMPGLGSLDNETVGRPVPSDPEMFHDYMNYLMSGHDLPRSEDDYDLIQELNSEHR